MTDLEQRLRESLRSRAGDVEPTPALWDEVERRVRRERWRTTWMWAGGAVAAAAAVVVAVVVGPAVLGDTPQDVTIDPLPSEQPSRPDDEQPTDGPTGAPATSPTHVVAASQKEIVLRTLDGQVVDTLVSYGDEFEGSILSVAARPGSTIGDLTVAFTVHVEGDVEVRLVTRGGDPETVDLSHQGWDGLLAPQAVWSTDGSQLYWIDATDGRVLLKSLHPEEDLPVKPLSLGNVDGLDQFQLQDATPDRRILSVTNALQARALVVASGQLTGVEQVAATGAAAVLDLAHVGAGQFVLSASCPEVPEGEGDAECAVFQLTYADGETPEGRPLPLPDVMTAGTASPYGAWLAAEQDTAVVGWGGLAWLVTLDGEPTELPGGTVAADLVLGAGASAEAPPVEDGTDSVPADPDDEVDDPDSGISPIPGGAYVAVTAEAIEYVDDRGSRQTLLSWPDGEAAVFKPSRVSVRPGSTSDDLTVVVLTAGEGETELGWIEVHDGQIGEYQAFPPQYQMARPLDGGSVGVPVWSPDGAYLAWFEEETTVDDVGASGFSLRVIGWDGGPGTGRTADDNASFGVDELSGGSSTDAALDQWMWNSENEGMLTFRYQRGDEFGTGSLAVGRQPDGAITYDGGVALSQGRFDEAIGQDAVYTLAVEGEVFIGIQQPGGVAEVALPDGYRSDLLSGLPPAAGPWLDVAHGGAILFSADQRAWHVAVDGTLTELGSGFRDLDPVR